jgi:hypothetical protein
MFSASLLALNIPLLAGHARERPARAQKNLIFPGNQSFALRVGFTYAFISYPPLDELNCLLSSR